MEENTPSTYLLGDSQNTLTTVVNPALSAVSLNPSTPSATPPPVVSASSDPGAGQASREVSVSSGRLTPTAASPSAAFSQSEQEKKQRKERKDKGKKRGPRKSSNFDASANQSESASFHGGEENVVYRDPVLPLAATAVSTTTTASSNISKDTTLATGAATGENNFSLAGLESLGEAASHMASLNATTTSNAAASSPLPQPHFQHHHHHHHHHSLQQPLPLNQQQQQHQMALMNESGARAERSGGDDHPSKKQRKERKDKGVPRTLKRLSSSTGDGMSVNLNTTAGGGGNEGKPEDSIILANLTSVENLSGEKLCMEPSLMPTATASTLLNSTGLAAGTAASLQRKVRKDKGMKRGPYKKRQSHHLNNPSTTLSSSELRLPSESPRKDVAPSAPQSSSSGQPPQSSNAPNSVMAPYSGEEHTQNMFILPHMSGPVPMSLPSQNPYYLAAAAAAAAGSNMLSGYPPQPTGSASAYPGIMLPDDTIMMQELHRQLAVPYFDTMEQVEDSMKALSHVHHSYHYPPPPPPPGPPSTLASSSSPSNNHVTNISTNNNNNPNTTEGMHFISH